MTAIETLISVLCDPEGKCCISGSDDDRRLIDSALAELAQAAPAQAGEPVAVVVPCYTPSGKRVALYSAKQDLPIGTKLYAAPQPSPTTHPADSVQEDAARESEYRRGYRHGYEQRDAEVRGAMA